MEKIEYLKAEKCYVHTKKCFGFRGDFLREFQEGNLTLYTKNDIPSFASIDEANDIEINPKDSPKMVFYRISAESLKNTRRHTIESSAFELKHACNEKDDQLVVYFEDTEFIGFNDLYVDIHEFGNYINQKMWGKFYPYTFEHHAPSN